MLPGASKSACPQRLIGHDAHEAVAAGVVEVPFGVAPEVSRVEPLRGKARQ